MKSPFLLCAALGATLPAAAAVVVSSGALNLAIPDDGGPGLVHTLQVNTPGAVAAVTVSLQVTPLGSGAWTGDLYAYLRHDTGLAVLLNRSGRSATQPFGYGDGQSLALTLSDDAANGDLHSYRLTLTGDEATALSAPLTGSWQPSGRLTDPAVVGAGDARTAMLGSFTGLEVAGGWSLFVADLVEGGQFRLDSWGVEITPVTPVPEPAMAAVAGAAGLLAWAAGRRRRHGRIVSAALNGRSLARSEPE